MDAFDPSSTLAIIEKNQRSKSNVTNTRAARESIRKKVYENKMRVDRHNRVKLNNVQFKMGNRRSSNPVEGQDIESSKMFDTLDDVF